MDDVDIEKLIQEVKQLIGKPATKSEDSVAGYQAPIKGQFFNSGGFSTNSPNPRHPQGHMGVDMRAPGGTAIYPMAPGVVTNVGTNPKGGNAVNIQHSNGIRTYYAHMGSAQVYKGDRVDYNTVIGTVGNTGNASSTAPHLHFQVWKDNQIQNPARYFAIPKYSEPTQQEKQWLSNDAIQNAQSFNMKKHLENRRQAFSNKTNTLLKLAFNFYSITKKI